MLSKYSIISLPNFIFHQNMYFLYTTQLIYSRDIKERPLKSKNPM